MSKRASAGAVVLLFAGGVAAMATTNAWHAADVSLLAQVMAAQSTVSYSGVVESVHIGAHATQASVYRIEHRAPDYTKKVYSAPPQLAGDSEIVEGDVRYAIDAQHHRIVETQSDAFTGGRALGTRASLIRENYESVQRGNEIFDGRAAIDVALVSDRTHRTAVFARIDRVTKVVLDRQDFDDDGALVAETRMEAISYGTVPPKEFSLPKEFTLVRAEHVQEPVRDPDGVVRAAGFAARKPAFPDGFAPLEGDLVDLHGAQAVQLLYSDGVRSVSLFESVTAVTPDMAPYHPAPVSIGGHDAKYGEDGNVALLTWNDGSLYYTLVGPLGLAELQRFARSVTP